MVSLRSLDGSMEMVDQIAKIYGLVWHTYDPSIREKFLRHSTYPGYRGFLLINDQDEPIGFSYGYISLPGQFYRGLLELSLEDEEIMKWLDDCFEFVELAIHPSHRKKGYGKLLLNKVLEGVNNKTAVLTTQVDNQPARTLYESFGWEVIKQPFTPFDENKPYVIMGKMLDQKSTIK